MEYNKQEILSLASNMAYTVKEEELENLLKRSAELECLNEFVLMLKIGRVDLIQDIDEIVDVYELEM